MMRCLMILFISLLTTQANAFNWLDLWYTPNQQGQYLMEKGQFAKAKEIFERPDWTAAAAYKSGDYERSAELFKELNTEQGYYNQGNALAHMGQYEQAIKAYNKALALNPKNQDAIYNLKLVKDLLKKDKEQNKDQKNKNQQNKNQQNKNQQNKEQQNKEQQNKEQQNKEQQNKEQQNKDQQNKDPQNKDQQNKDQENKDQQNKDQENKDQQNKEEQEKNKAKQNKKNKKQDQSKAGEKKKGEAQSEADREKQQAKQQWLNLIPDDPGGLMREKFLRDHLRRERGWYQ